MPPEPLAVRDGRRFLSEGREAEQQAETAQNTRGKVCKATLHQLYEYPLEARRAGIFNGLRLGARAI